MAYKVQYTKRFTSGLLEGIDVPCFVTYSEKTQAERFKTWIESQKEHFDVWSHACWAPYNVQLQEVPNNG